MAYQEVYLKHITAVLQVVVGICQWENRSSEALTL